MRLKFIERIKFRLTGRSVPVVRMTDIGNDGKVNTIHLMGELKARPNSLVNPWDDLGYEIVEGEGFITLIGEDGIPKGAYVVTPQGRTANIYVQPFKGPAWEQTIGRRAAADDIADSLDMGRSTRNYIIGAIIGMALYAGLIGPMLLAVLQ